jgi:synaptobrevin family protein YKT6
MQVEKQLQEVNEIMRKNMKDLMARGETIEDLMEKSKDLSTASVSFYKKAKKANTRCCDLS